MASSKQNPTWLDDVQYFFTQYDQIQMAPHGVDLTTYQGVSERAGDIYQNVSAQGEWQMPLYEQRWTTDKLGRFKAWMDEGCPYGPAPATAPERNVAVETFIAVSEVLTGFDDLEKKRALARVYMQRLKTEVSSGNQLLDALLGAFEEIQASDPTDPESAVQSRIMNDPTLGPFAQTVILLWYMASINGVLGTPEHNQYIHGLMWPAIDAHPMGYSNEDILVGNGNPPGAPDYPKWKFQNPDQKTAYWHYPVTEQEGKPPLYTGLVDPIG